MTAESRPPLGGDGVPAAGDALRTRAYRELADALDRIPFRRAHVLILVLVASGALFDAIEQYNVGLAAPLIAKQWSLSNSQVGLLTTLTFAGMALGSLIAGVTGDRYGRRITYMYNLALYTLGALLAAFAPNFEVLLVARLVVGIGLGGELNTGLTLVAELMPTKFRGAAVATVNVAAGGLESSLRPPSRPCSSARSRARSAARPLHGAGSWASSRCRPSSSSSTGGSCPSRRATSSLKGRCKRPTPCSHALPRTGSGRRWTCASPPTSPSPRARGYRANACG